MKMIIIRKSFKVIDELSQTVCRELGPEMLFCQMLIKI